MLPVIPGAALVTARGTILGAAWANVFGLKSLSPPIGGGNWGTQADANAVGEATRDLYEVLGASLSNDWALTDIHVQFLDSDTSPGFVTAATGFAGSSTSENMPRNLALCASHKTGNRGKSFRGRTYLAGWTEGSNGDTGVASSAATALVVSAFSTFRTSLAAIPTIQWRHAVISRKLSLATEVTSTSCDARWDHIDRRK